MNKTRGWWRFAGFALVGCVAVTSAAPIAHSDSSPAPGPRAAVSQASAATEMSGRFALRDESVVGTFQWFAVADGAPRFTPGPNPQRLGRIEVRGVETAIAAWWGEDELRIFRSDTPRGTAFTCGCAVELDAAPTPGRVVAEALSCMELPVGRAGLEMQVTRERAIDGLGPITRAVRGMPGRTSDAAWVCDPPPAISAATPSPHPASLGN